MNEDTKKRLMQFIKYLGMTTRAFEIKCGMSNGYIRSMRKGLGDDKLNNVLTMFPQLRRDWLLFGEGEMLYTDVPALPALQEVNTYDIRYWEDVSATGGSMEFLENPDEHEVKMINVPRFADCTDAVNIYGDSMYPVYKSGEIILIKPWQESFIDYGCCYLIVTQNGNRMVKYLKRSDNPGKVLCVSENKHFDSFEIDRSDILRLFLVRGSIKSDTI